MFFIFLILVIATVLSVKCYNRLQSQKQSVLAQSSNIQVSLKKRLDLEEKIMNIAQGVADHEKITHVMATSNGSSSESLSALSQNFPELKANQTFQQLMSQLEELESEIAQKREFYNAIVENYNSYRSSFPALLIANKLKFQAAPYYDSGDEELLEKISTFNRDDAEAVNALLEASKKSFKNSALSIKNAAAGQLDSAKNSETYKSIIKQADISIQTSEITENDDLRIKK